MIEVYAIMVLDGRTSLDKVPSNIREAVQLRVEFLRDNPIHTL